MSTEQVQKIRVYSQRLPAHLLLHIRNYESNGYWDFWRRQDAIEGHDCGTICGILDSIGGKLDAESDVPGHFSGQLMAYVYEADGRRAEAYGVRLPADWRGVRPEQMQLLRVAEGEYMVFEHPAFDYEEVGATVLQRVNEAADAFDYSRTEYALDATPGRVAYFHHDPTRYCRIVRPVRNRTPGART